MKVRLRASLSDDKFSCWLNQRTLTVPNEVQLQSVWALYLHLQALCLHSRLQCRIHKIQLCSYQITQIWSVWPFPGKIFISQWLDWEFWGMQLLLYMIEVKMGHPLCPHNLDTLNWPSITPNICETGLEEDFITMKHCKSNTQTFLIRFLHIIHDTRNTQSFAPES